MLRVYGNFSSDHHYDFYSEFMKYPKDEKKFIVDLAETDSIDSAALGMLLQLVKHSSNSSSLELVNVNKSICQTLKITSFDLLIDTDCR